MATRKRATKKDDADENGASDVTAETQAVDAAGRFEALRDAVGELRTRTGTIDLERPLLIAGAVMLPLGLIAIFLGWLGASRTPYEFEQIPYLISGGLLGVALAITGGFLYFGYWLTRMVNQQRDQTQELSEAIHRLEESLNGSNGSSGSRSRSKRSRSAA